MSSFDNTKGNKWKRYNRWRSENRALDRQRRLEKQAERRSAYVAGYTAPKVVTPRKPKADFRIRIYLPDGTSVGFSISRGPFGLTTSPTLAGRKVAAMDECQLAELINKTWLTAPTDNPAGNSKARAVMEALGLTAKNRHATAGKGRK